MKPRMNIFQVAPEVDYVLITVHFNETEIAYLTLLIGAINVWNRVQVGLRWIHPVEGAKAA